MLDTLNEKQQEAVTHIEGPLLIIAGAGSGKTRVVTHRIAHLLDLGTPASDIVAVTFTNKAAEEMGVRIRQQSAQSVLTCTFHSLAARILRESIHALGYTNSFNIYDEDDSLSLIKTCLQALGHKDDKATVKTLKSGISNAKNSLLHPKDCLDDELLAKVFELYQNKLKEYSALDFDDLLFLTVELFETHPEILSRYQDRWSFILIDEYQDTNHAQYLMTKMLAGKHHNVFAVGDPDQSIYSWRGANIRNILDFEKDFPGAKIIKLEQNYRSTNHILSAANSLIENNEGRYAKNLWSELGEGDKVDVRICENENEEISHVVKQIMEHYRSGFTLSEMVVFYRTNAQSRSIEDALLKGQIPYVIIGGMSFYQRREIKDTLSLLRAAVVSCDFLSFARTINLPKRGIGKALLAKLQVCAENSSMPIIDLCRGLIAGTHPGVKLNTKQRTGISEYLETLDHIQNQIRDKTPIREIIANAIERSGYLRHLKEDELTYNDRCENLEELVSKAAEWEQESPSPSLEGFLEELTLKASTRDDHAVDTVKLMTLHNGKGLEFSVVFLIGMEEDLLPHVNSKNDYTALEEERRLCYVGMTRAKKHLYLSASRYRLIWGSPRMMETSRFLSELPREHLNWHQDEDESDERYEFQPGCYVRHKDFGRGIVKKAYMSSMGPTYEVYFVEANVSRTLVAKYARLKLDQGEDATF